MDESKSPGAGDRYWGSRAGFILASLGSAAGLGNIWRFAYVAGENGGGAFLFVYIACVLMIGLPIMIAEFAMWRAQGAADLRVGPMQNPPRLGELITPVTRWRTGVSSKRERMRGDAARRALRPRGAMKPCCRSVSTKSVRTRMGAGERAERAP